MDQVNLDMQVSLGPGHIVLDGDPAPLPPKGYSPQFRAHICCGQMAQYIKMSLGMEVGHGPGHIVLDGHPAPPPQKKNKEQSPPIFGPFLLSPNGCMYQHTTWYGGIGLSLGDIVLDGNPTPPHQKGHSPPPQFSANVRYG